MEWLEASRGANRTQFDGEVILAFEKEKYVLFKFRKNSNYKITDKEYLVVAKDGNRIYFKEAEENRGFKLSSWTNRVKCFKIAADRLQLTKNDVGEYNLEYDVNLHLHYICLVRKLEKPGLNWENR